MSFVETDTTSVPCGWFEADSLCCLDATVVVKRLSLPFLDGIYPESGI